MLTLLAAKRRLCRSICICQVFVRCLLINDKDPQNPYRLLIMNTIKTEMSEFAETKVLDALITGSVLTRILLVQGSHTANYKHAAEQYKLCILLLPPFGVSKKPARIHAQLVYATLVSREKASSLMADCISLTHI